MLIKISVKSLKMFKIFLLSIAIQACQSESSLGGIEPFQRSAIAALFPFVHDVPKHEKDYQQDISQTSRFQSVRLAEGTLSGLKGDCLKRLLCAIAVIKSGMTPPDGSYLFPRISPGRGIEDFKRILEEMVVDIQKNGAENEFPHILGHLASYSVGRSTKDQQICNDLFICPTSAEVLILDGMQDQGFMMDGESDDGEVTKRKYQSRSNCKTAGFLCPGIAIGCSMCGVFLPGSCGEQCITAGLYCGVSGYACQI